MSINDIREQNSCLVLIFTGAEFCPPLLPIRGLEYPFGPLRVIDGSECMGGWVVVDTNLILC